MTIGMEKNNSKYLIFSINVNDIIDKKESGFEIKEEKLKTVLEE